MAVQAEACAARFGRGEQPGSLAFDFSARTSWHSWYMRQHHVGPPPAGGAAPDGSDDSRQAWVRANFTQIFGTSAGDLQSRRIDPREYARQHRDQIRAFAQTQRNLGIAVPPGGSANARGSSYNGPYGQGPSRRGYGYGSRFGLGRRGGGGWIGIGLVLFAVRFLLVDSLAGPHAAIFWVLGIGGIMLLARVFLFSWLRSRRRNRR